MTVGHSNPKQSFLCGGQQRQQPFQMHMNQVTDLKTPKDTTLAKMKGCPCRLPGKSLRDNVIMVELSLVHQQC